MMNRPPHFRGLNIRISIIIPAKVRGSINQGSSLVSGSENVVNGCLPTSRCA